MTTINSLYPHGMKDEEIEGAIKEYSAEIHSSKANMNTVLQFSPLIQLGQLELQRRQTKRVTTLSVIFSIVSLLVAGSALFVSFYSSRASSRWERSQINLLKELKAEASNISPNLEGTINRATERNIQTRKKSAEKTVSIIEKLELTTPDQSLEQSRKSGTALKRKTVGVSR